MKCDFKNTAPIIISLIVTLGFFFCMYRLSTSDVPASNRDIFNGMTGVLGTVWIKVIGFFFDSSASSKAKDETISEIAKNVTPSAPITIPNADSVSVKTESGDVSIASKDNQSTIPQN